MRRKCQEDQLALGCYWRGFTFLNFSYSQINVYIILQLIQRWSIILRKMQINEEQRRKIDIDERGNPLMTVKTIKYYCYKDYLFQTPELNQKLYLHFKGFKQIDSMDKYPNLVTIWLNNNCISKIQGLTSLKNLICLYLNNNVISKIQNLEGLDNLSILHLGHNKIDKIEGIGCLKSLNSLNLSQNFLNSAQSIIGLRESNSLTSVDLSKNELENNQQVFSVICSLLSISCLCLKNTPIARSYKNYRKNLIYSLKGLKYLDDRPIKQIDHRLAEAWKKGGTELENQERILIACEKQQKNTRQTNKLNQKIKRERKKEQEIETLQEKKRNMEFDQGSAQSKREQIEEIERRLQILKDGPKGFQALITQTSLKVLHVEEEEQEKIINKYFFNQKLKIQENKRKLEKSKENEEKPVIDEDQRGVQQKIRNILDFSFEKMKITELKAANKWSSKYEPILEALLQKFKYDFQNVCKEFNKIVSGINRKMMRPFIKFQSRELQSIWTVLYLSRKSSLSI